MADFMQLLHSWLTRGAQHTIPEVAISATSQPFSLGASEAHLGEVGSRVFGLSGAFVRPNNNTTYTANTAVAGTTSFARYITFPNAARISGAGITITGIELFKSSLQTANANFRLFLHKDPPVASPNDNEAFAQPFANRTSLIGYADFGSMLSGSNCTYGIGTLSSNFIGPFKPSGTDIYGILQATSTYGPSAALEEFDFFIYGFGE
jgi:hypothetical protein